MLSFVLRAGQPIGVSFASDVDRRNRSYRRPGCILTPGRCFLYTASTASSYVTYPSVIGHTHDASSSSSSGVVSTIPTPPTASHPPTFNYDPYPRGSSSSSPPFSSFASSSSSWDYSSDASTSSSSAYSSASSTPYSTLGSSSTSRRESSNPFPSDRYSVIHDVLNYEDLYEVLGVTKTSDLPGLRRAYITRSKRCHPE